MKQLMNERKIKLRGGNDPKLFPIFLHFQDIGLNGSWLIKEQSEKSDNDLLINFVPEKETFDNCMLYSKSLFHLRNAYYFDEYLNLPFIFDLR